MHYITQDWDITHDGRLFFIQRLEEMLFHYSDDIVKAPVHNTSTLIEEYHRAKHDKNIKQVHLNVISEEIKDSLGKDPIAKEKLGIERIEGIIKGINTQQKDTLHYLLGIMTTSSYFDWSREYLLKHIDNHSHKKEIEAGLRAWVSAVSWAGYSLEYVYRTLQNEFCKPVDNPEKAVSDFINLFNSETHQYRVYLLFLSSTHKFKDLLVNRLHVNLEDDGNFNKLKSKYYNSFVGYLNIEAKDPYEARGVANRGVEIINGFYKVLSNKKKPLIGKTCLVIDQTSLKSLYVTMDAQGYKTIESEFEQDMPKLIDYVVLGCQTKPKTTYNRLRRMIDLHNMALEQIDMYDGFVNLWSTLEVVSWGSEIESKIEAVIDSCLPIIKNDYLSKYFSSLALDIKHALSRKEYLNLLDNISQGGDAEQKIMALTFLEEYEAKRDELFIKLKEYPNIRQKMYTMYMLKDNRNKVYQLSERYAQRVKWHLYRLYRVRNGIVHAGEQSSNIQVLGGHLHIYCDGVIHEVINKFAMQENLKTIRDVLVDTKLLVSEKNKYFNSEGPVTEKDILCYNTNYFDELARIMVSP